MVWENGIYWHYLSSWCQPDSINSCSEEWMRLWALSGRIVPVSCLLFACLPLSVMKTFLLMAGVWEAKPILQFLIAAPQILCSSYSTAKPLFFLPPSKHAFNQLLDLELKSSFKDMLMNAMKEQSVSTGKGWWFNTLWKLFAKQSFEQLPCPLALSTFLSLVDKPKIVLQWQMWCLSSVEDIWDNLGKKKKLHVTIEKCWLWFESILLKNQCDLTLFTVMSQHYIKQSNIKEDTTIQAAWMF